MSDTPTPPITPAGPRPGAGMPAWAGWLIAALSVVGTSLQNLVSNVGPRVDALERAVQKLDDKLDKALEKK